MTQTQELTPEQIVEYSRVIAEYMGWEKRESQKGECKLCWTKCGGSSVRISAEMFVNNWNIVHEVWEKLKKDKLCDRMSTSKKIYLMNAIAWHTKEEVFILLKDTINFINSLNK